jgi:sugar phosphate isomerase/epimerase
MHLLFHKIRYALPGFFLFSPCVSFAQSSNIHWKHLSSVNGELPKPWNSTQQTSALIVDLDKDGVNDFVVSCREVAPVLVWYRHTAKGWQRFVLEKQFKTIEAGGAFSDIDNDGDPDLVYGQDWQGPEMWWWENPYPDYDTTVPWKRHTIKTTGKTQHHDQVFGDFLQTGKPQLAFWNQGNNTLNLAFIPDDPRNANEWKTQIIFSGEAGSKQSWYPEGIAAADVDGDGYADLLAGNLWFRYKGNGIFKPIHVARIGGRIAVGKFKPGKTLQIVTAPGDGIGPVCWYECTGDPEDSSAWVEHKLLNRDLIHAHTLAVADINGDGYPDIYTAEMAQWTEKKDSIDNPAATAYIFYGDGKGNFSTTVFQKGIGFHESKIGDLDNDGDEDILDKPYTWKSPRVDVFLQNGTGKLLPSLQTLNNKYALEIYSLRDDLNKDVPAALEMIKRMGFEEIEVPGYYGLSAEEFRSDLQRSGLKATSLLFDYDRYKKDPEGIIKEARSFDVKYVGFGWIPHRGTFNKTDADSAIIFMNKTGNKLKAAGLHFFYHAHGYEFVRAEEGTLFDYMVQHTNKDAVSFQLDVFWATRGGADAALLLQKYPYRFSSLHIKDIQWGVPTSDYTGEAQDTASVVIGKGQVNWHEVLKTAIKEGIQYYYIEDESPDALRQIPQSLSYLKSLH